MDGQPNGSGQDELPHDQPVSLRPAPAPFEQVVPPASPELPPVLPPVQPVVPSSQPETPAQAAPQPDYQQQAPTAPEQPSAIEGDLIPSDSELTWTASEFIAHPKTILWYLTMSGISLVILVLAFVVTHDIITTIFILIAAGLFGYMASRQPRQLAYALGPKGVTVGSKFHPYADFRAFAVIEEGHFSSIDFVPLKRFAPMLSIYYDPAHEERVMQILSQHLPYAQHSRTAIDNLMHRIRF